MMDHPQVEKAHQDLQQLKQTIAQALIGQHLIIDQVLICLLAGGHGLIEGVPGLGKTLLVRALSQAVSGKFSRLQFTPDLMPSDITGHTLFDMQNQQWKIRQGPVFCNFLLADEINRAPAKTQSALLEVMQEQQVTIEGSAYPLASPYLVLATQNSIEQEGTYPLPEAQLDRFLMKILMDYPTEDEEKQMVRDVTYQTIGDKLDVSKVSVCLTPQRVIELQGITAHLQMDQQLVDYAVRITRATRTWSSISVGSGPRGSIALLRAARANALLSGRHFVTPDDVKAMAIPVLRHRVSLSADYAIEGYRTDQVLVDVIESIAAPRI